MAKVPRHIAYTHRFSLLNWSGAKLVVCLLAVLLLSNFRAAAQGVDDSSEVEVGIEADAPEGVETEEGESEATTIETETVPDTLAERPTEGSTDSTMEVLETDTTYDESADTSDVDGSEEMAEGEGDEYIPMEIIPPFDDELNPPNPSHFSGIIKYNVEYIAKDPAISSEELSEKFGSTMYLLIRDDHYKFLVNGQILQEVLFSSSAGQMQYRTQITSKADSVNLKPFENEQREFIKKYHSKEQSYIMDYLCDAYTLITGSSSLTYLFDPKMKVETKNLKVKGLDYFNTFLNMYNAPYLKYIYEGVQFKKIVTAAWVVPMPLSSTMFRLGDVAVPEEYEEFEGGAYGSADTD